MARQAARTCSSVRSGRAGRPSAANGSVRAGHGRAPAPNASSSAAGLTAAARARSAARRLGRDDHGRAGWAGGGGSGRGEGRGRAIWTQVQPPAWMYPAWPVSRARAMLRVDGPGVLDPGGSFVAPHAADDLGRGLHDPPGAGQFADRLGVGGAQQPDPAVSGGGDPVPLILSRAQSLPGLRRHLHPDAQRPAALIQLPQRHLARTRPSSHRRPAGWRGARCRGWWRRGGQLESAPWPGLRRRSVRGCLPG